MIGNHKICIRMQTDTATVLGFVAGNQTAVHIHICIRFNKYAAPLASELLSRTLQSYRLIN